MPRADPAIRRTNLVPSVGRKIYTGTLDPLYVYPHPREGLRNRQGRPGNIALIGIGNLASILIVSVDGLAFVPRGENSFRIYEGTLCCTVDIYL